MLSAWKQEPALQACSPKVWLQNHSAKTQRILECRQSGVWSYRQWAAKRGYQAAIDSKVGTSLPPCPDLPQAQEKEQRLVCRDGTHKGPRNSAVELARGSSLMSGELGRVGLQVTKAGRSKWEELKFNSKHVASRGDLTNFGDLNAKLVSIFQVALGNGKLERKQS